MVLSQRRSITEKDVLVESPFFRFAGGFGSGESLMYRFDMMPVDCARVR